jgi:hypothetical protein
MLIRECFPAMQHGVHALRRLLNLEIWLTVAAAQRLCFPLQPVWATLLPLTRLNHYTSVPFMEVMGGSEARAQNMSFFTQLVCTSASPLIA